jgi:hypothetical protein
MTASATERKSKAQDVYDSLTKTNANRAGELYGRLVEGVHITGYAFERACHHLELLLEGDGWKLGGRFNDVNGFLDSIRLDEFRPNVERRQRIVRRLKELQPEASNRQIGKTLGVSDMTVGRDLATNVAAPEPKTQQDQQSDVPFVGTDPRPDVMAAEDVVEPGGEFTDLIAARAQGWTGATAATQTEVDAATERLRDDSALGHWLVLAPRERLVVDHRVVQWLLLTAPTPPEIARIEWVFALCSAARIARCPIWVCESLTGKSRTQRAGMTWPRELPIPPPQDELEALCNAWDGAGPEARRGFLDKVGLRFTEGDAALLPASPSAPDPINGRAAS